MRLPRGRGAGSASPAETQIVGRSHLPTTRPERRRDRIRADRATGRSAGPGSTDDKEAVARASRRRPGTSKMIASGPSSTSRNGSTSSIFAPIPLNRRSGGRDLSPGRMPTRKVCPPTSRKPIFNYFSITYWPGLRPSGGISAVPRLPGAGFFSPDRFLIQLSQCGHQLPASLLACSSHSSAVSACAGPVQKNGLGIAGRVDQTLNVAAVREHKRTPLSVKLRRVVASLPRRDVISQPGNHIAVQV